MKVPPAVLLHLPFTFDPNVVLEADGSPPIATETGLQPHRTLATEVWLQAHRRDLESSAIRYERRPVRGDFDNYNAFLSVWFDPVTLLHLDHDCVPSLALVLEMARCAYPACTAVYRLAEAAGAPLATFVETPTYSDVEGTFSMAVDSPKAIPEWCDRTGFGLVKLDFGQRIRHPLPPAATSWVGFDSWYCGFIKQREPCFKWHVHAEAGGLPMRHEH